MELPETKRERDLYPSLNWIPTIVQQLDLELTRSSSNISPPGSGLLETPLGVGLDTRFQVRNNPLHLERKDIEQ